MDAPGSPMYSSAHFISSKTLSAFVGYPMPEDYPDYPSWRQIRDYIRSFARDFGLYDHVTLGVAVVGAEPLPGDRGGVLTLRSVVYAVADGGATVVAMSATRLSGGSGDGWHPLHSPSVVLEAGEVTAACAPADLAASASVYGRAFGLAAG